MTPEEMEQRWTWINNSMQFVTEQQAKHEARMDELEVKHRTRMDELEAKIAEEAAESRRVQTSMSLAIMEYGRLTAESFKKADERSSETDEKLNVLIDTVNRMIIDRGDKTVLPRYIPPKKKEGE